MSATGETRPGPSALPELPPEAGEDVGVPPQGREAGTDQDLVRLADIRRAEASLPPSIARHLVTEWRPGVWLKLESLQPSGSFKIRGATWKLMTAADSARSRGVVAYSSGNHGRALALAARSMGARATIVVPGNAPKSKLGGIAGDGVTLVRCQPGSELRRQLAEDLARSSGAVLVPPYGDLDVIAGQGTVGLELAEQIDGLDAVVVPVGGGGLASGVGAAVKAIRPAIKVIGVEPSLAADAAQSLREGHIAVWPVERVGRTIADGVRTQSLSALTFRHMMRYVDDMVAVGEAEILAAMGLLLNSCHLVVEPAGALPMAALLAGSLPDSARVALVVSGGNTSAGTLQRALGSGHAPRPARTGAEPR